MQNVKKDIIRPTKCHKRPTRKKLQTAQQAGDQLPTTPCKHTRTKKPAIRPNARTYRAYFFFWKIFFFGMYTRDPLLTTTRKAEECKRIKKTQYISKQDLV